MDNQGKRILLVDDDPDIRESLAIYLSGKGYSVYQESGGDGAISRYQHSSPFYFVLSDFRFIPGQKTKIRNGGDLMREIRKLNPAQRMAIMTGDAYEAQAGMDASVKDVPMLKKPFRLQELVGLIEKA